MFKILKYIPFLAIFFVGGQLYAQGTLADYKRAEAVDSLFKGKVYHAPDAFHWFNNQQFWYKDFGPNGENYLLVHVKDQSQKPIFDTKKLAENLQKLTKNEVKPTDLKLTDLEFNEDKSKLIF